MLRMMMHLLFRMGKEVGRNRKESNHFNLGTFFLVYIIYWRLFCTDHIYTPLPLGSPAATYMYPYLPCFPLGFHLFFFDKFFSKSPCWSFIERIH